MDPTRAAAPRAPHRPRATLQEWLAIPEDARAELIDGAIVYQGFPGPRHGFSQGGVFAQIWPYNRRPRRAGGGGGPGGWWISQEVDMAIGGVGCRPDVLGWRREKHPRLPEPDPTGVTTVVPDFICEVLSPSTARMDQGPKRRAYFEAGVSHYWLVDPTYESLTVLVRGMHDYEIALVAGPGEMVRAAPFDLVEIPIADLFPDEAAEETEEGPAR